ncbi:unnamed protein product [Amoebophrya sp. A120]|nr:unnamed protein product [Amoebophrya sp. A120]|eukprot:GSA120T00011419001.1
MQRLLRLACPVLCFLLRECGGIGFQNLAPPSYKYREAKEAAMREAALRNAGTARNALSEILTALFEVKEASFNQHEKEKKAFERKQRGCGSKLPQLQSGLLKGDQAVVAAKKVLKDVKKGLEKWTGFLEKVNGKIQGQERDLEQKKRDLAAAIRSVEGEEREKKHVLAELLRAAEMQRSPSSTAQDKIREILQALKLPTDNLGKVEEFAEDAGTELDEVRKRKKDAKKDQELALHQAKQTAEKLQERKEEALAQINQLEERAAGGKDDLRMAEKQLDQLSKSAEDQEVLCGVAKYEWDQSTKQFAQQMKDFFFAEKMLGKTEESVNSFLSLEQHDNEQMKLMRENAEETTSSTSKLDGAETSTVAAAAASSSSSTKQQKSNSLLPWRKSETNDYFSTHDVMPWLLHGDHKVEDHSKDNAKRETKLDESKTRAQSPPPASISTSPSADIDRLQKQKFLLTDSALLDKAFDIVDNVVNGPLEKPVMTSDTIPFTTVKLGNSDSQESEKKTPPAAPTFFLQLGSKTATAAGATAEGAKKHEHHGRKAENLRNMANAALDALSRQSLPSNEAATTQSLITTSVEDDLVSPAQEEEQLQKQIDETTGDTSTTKSVALLQAGADGRNRKTNDQQAGEQDSITSLQSDEQESFNYTAERGRVDPSFDRLQAAAKPLDLLQAALLSQTTAAGPFDKVRRMITDMIGKVRTEMAAAQDKKAMCESEAEKNRKQRSKLRKALTGIDQQMSVVDKTLRENGLAQDDNRNQMAKYDVAVQDASNLRADDKQISDGLLHAGKTQLQKLDRVVQKLRELYEDTLEDIHFAKEARENDEFDSEDFVRGRSADVGFSLEDVKAAEGNGEEVTSNPHDLLPTFAAPVEAVGGGVSNKSEGRVQVVPTTAAGVVSAPAIAQSAGLAAENVQAERGRSLPPVSSVVLPVQPLTAAVVGQQAAPLPQQILSPVPQPQTEVFTPVVDPRATSPSFELVPLAQLPMLNTIAAPPDLSHDLERMLESSNRLVQFGNNAAKSIITNQRSSVRGATMQNTLTSSFTSFLQQAQQSTTSTSFAAATALSRKAVNEKIEDEVREEEQNLEREEENQESDQSIGLRISPVTVDSWRRALALVEKVAENQMLKLFVVRGADLRDRALFDQFVATQKLAKAELEKSNLFLQRRMEKQKTLLNNLNTDREEKLKELSYVENYSLELKQTCAGPSAEEAKKRREQEIDGLKDALSILSGEEAA